MMNRASYGMSLSSRPAVAASAPAPAAPAPSMPSMGGGYGMSSPVRGLSLSTPAPVSSHLMGQNQGQSVPNTLNFADFLTKLSAQQPAADPRKSLLLGQIMMKAKQDGVSSKDGFTQYVKDNNYNVVIR